MYYKKHTSQTLIFPINNERPPQEPSGPEASQVSPVRSLTKYISIIKTNHQYTSGQFSPHQIHRLSHYPYIADGAIDYD